VAIEAGAVSAAAVVVDRGMVAVSTVCVSQSPSVDLPGGLTRWQRRRLIRDFLQSRMHRFGRRVTVEQSKGRRRAPGSTLAP
jgi:hypothetical protein